MAPVTRLLLLAAVMVAVCAPFPASGAAQVPAYSVSPNGSDRNSCSAQAPCREITRALALVKPGSGATILVADGQYQGFTVNGVKGTAEAPVTVKAQGKNAVIAARDSARDRVRGNINIVDSAYITIDGLRTFDGTGANMAGISVRFSPHVTIRNCVAGRNSAWGIFSSHAEDLVLENNECFDSKIQHGIYVSNSADRPVLRGNRSHDNKGAGIQLNGDQSDAGLTGPNDDGVISGALLENNVLFGNGGGINQDGVQDTIIRNNLLYGNHGSGVTGYHGDGAAGPKNLQIYSNTIVMAADAKWAIRLHHLDGAVMLRSNILCNPNPAMPVINIGTEGDRMPSADVAKVNSDYNVICGNSSPVTANDLDSVMALRAWQATGHDSHSFTASLAALFIDAPRADYHLAANSPAIGRGAVLPGPARDLEGRARAAQNPDIGAYEHAPPR